MPFQNYYLITFSVTLLWFFVHDAAVIPLCSYDSNPYLSSLDEFINSPFYCNCLGSLKSTSALISSRAFLLKWLINCLRSSTHIYTHTNTRLSIICSYASLPHVFLTPSSSIQRTLTYTTLRVLLLEIAIC